MGTVGSALSNAPGSCLGEAGHFNFEITREATVTGGEVSLLGYVRV